MYCVFFFSSRRRHTRCSRDWSSDVCSSDLAKGYHWAVEAAKRTGHRLIVAGGWRPSFTGSIKFVGEVDGTTKAALLARARCLWNPAAWDEPFGLVTIEAFFSGTPVRSEERRVGKECRSRWSPDH